MVGTGRKVLKLHGIVSTHYIIPDGIHKVLKLYGIHKVLKLCGI